MHEAVPLTLGAFICLFVFKIPIIGARTSVRGTFSVLLLLQNSPAFEMTDRLCYDSDSDSILLDVTKNG